MSLFGSIARGALTVGGRLAGNALLPGIGGVAGGALGAWAANKLGGGGGRAAAPAAGDPRSALLGRMQTTAMQPATETPLFQAGRTLLAEDAERQAGVDAARLASTGATGGEAEVALAAGRGQNMASALTRLLPVAEGAQAADRAALLGSYDRDQARDDARKASRFGAIGQGLSVAAQVLPDLIRKK